MRKIFVLLAVFALLTPAAVFAGAAPPDYKKDGKFFGAIRCDSGKTKLNGYGRMPEWELYEIIAESGRIFIIMNADEKQSWFIKDTKPTETEEYPFAAFDLKAFDSMFSKEAPMTHAWVIGAPSDCKPVDSIKQKEG